MIAKLLLPIPVLIYAACCLIAVDVEFNRNSIANLLGSGRLMAQSTHAAHATMLDCDRLMNGRLYQYFIKGRFAQERDACLAEAEAILRSRPTQGYAWYVKALSLGFAGQRAEAEASAFRSQAVSQHEGWLAARRVRAYLDLVGFENVSGSPRFWSDVEEGLKFRSSRRWLSGAYLKYPQFRSQFDEILKRAQRSHQRAFFVQVDLLLAGSGS